MHAGQSAVKSRDIAIVTAAPILVAAAFIGEGLPVFKSGEVEKPANMMIDRETRGRALARALADKPAVLLRGHGVAVVAASLKSAVVRTYYLDMNGRLQAQAIALMERALGDQAKRHRTAVVSADMLDGELKSRIGSDSLICLPNSCRFLWV